jgi:hypothetical protein
MRASKLVLVLTVVALAFTGVACDSGGDSQQAAPASAASDGDLSADKRPDQEESEDAVSTEPSERERFIRRSDVLCAKVLDRIAALPLATDLSSAADLTERATGFNDRLVDQMESSTPARFRTKMNPLYERVRDLSDLTRESLIPAMEAEDLVTVQSVGRRIVKETRAVNSEMRKFGFKDCSRGQ